jgi:hypothetical protein
MILSREYAKSELDSIRDLAVGNGAVGVAWTRPNDESVFSQQVNKVDLNRPIFEQWLDSIDLVGYDKELLLALHQGLVDKAEDEFIKASGTESE